MKLNQNQKDFLSAVSEVLGAREVVSRGEIDQVVAEKGVKFPFWLVNKSEYRDRKSTRLNSSH